VSQILGLLLTIIDSLRYLSIILQLAWIVIDYYHQHEARILYYLL